MWSWTSGISASNWYHGKQKASRMGKKDENFGSKDGYPGSRISKCPKQTGSKRSRDIQEYHIL